MFDYPALYDTASKLSSNSQVNYLRLIFGEYLLLFIAAVFSMELNDSRLYYGVYAFVFLGSFVVLITRSWLKPEQDWYKGRALAESIKTSCWRYCMRAEPFADAHSVLIPRSEFRNYLRAILESNRHIGDRLPPDKAAADQITQTMEVTRSLSLEERKSVYQKHRIAEQRKWYAKKASANKSASKRWFFVAGCAYAIALGLVIFRIVYNSVDVWPIEPVIVVASSIIGWTQVKKFNELASSYTLTAHEIGILQGKIDEVTDETSLSSFINESEQAFSREHTQWVARQTS
ncbi:DUF4231 domain-containing protein [Acidisoma silvae]|uniref:DUF4231 domain-containing protein n=1 Tax=Acidisoma silvae TaxID=2802396 RepID=A0A964E0J8_9PROT|nr:DUF4231 domain-containing protein [Acidisoma silvae]MCB8877590.1 DUF4231 domain-containing protein [Acidisoma silvae]